MKNNKKIIIIACILVILIVAAVTFLLRSGRDNTSATQSETTTTATTTTVSTTVKKTTTTAVQTGKPTELNEDTPYKDKGGRWTKGIIRLNGFYKVKAEGDKEAKYHYFENGLINDSYTGISYCEDTDDCYYLTNGEIDKTFNGLISISRELHVFKNGIMQKNYNGTIELPNGKFEVVNGAIKDFNVGNPDGYEYKPLGWALDDGTQIINVKDEDLKES